ncbi:MAG: HIT family protein [bacterium]
MRYITIVKKLEKTHTCPFCHEVPEHILEESKHFFVLPARAQYAEHHLVIVPKRHANLLGTLTKIERTELYALVDRRVIKLHTKHSDISLLLRDGLVKDPLINKSVNHLHFHLMPDTGVHIKSKTRSEDRVRLEDKEYAELTKKYKTTFLS